MASLSELQQQMVMAQAALDAFGAPYKAAGTSPPDALWGQFKALQKAVGALESAIRTATLQEAAASGAPRLYIGLDPVSGIYQYSQNGVVFLNNKPPTDAELSASGLTINAYAPKPPTVAATSITDPVPATATVVTPIVTSPAPPAAVAPASDPGVVVGAPIATPTIEVKPLPAAPYVNADTAGEAAAQQNVAMMKTLDDTGIDAQIAANQRQADIIAEQENVSQESLAADQSALDAAMNEAIQAQQTEAQDYAFSTGYNNIQDQKDAENQQALDQIAADQIAADEAATSELQRETNRGLTSESTAAKAKATSQDVSNFKAKEDWRVRLSLAPGATYLYKAKNAEGILLPLVKTDGVIFPYTPNIQVTYAASYKDEQLTHSNYKVFQYSSSSVDTIQLTCDFTAQDTDEADYLLAVIHFFKSVTKMFYGQDENPSPGVPPPLCYLTGLGQFQFDAHPLAITSFTYNLPTDVDYIRSGSGIVVPGANTNPGGTGSVADAGSSRMATSNLQPGGGAAPPKFNLSSAATNTQATYVPTKMVITLTAIPIVSRNDISTQFSLKKYATGELLQGTKRNGGGIW